MDKSQMPIEVQPFAITAENLWGDNGAGVDDFLNNFANHVAPNVKMHISGQEFALAGDANGIDQIKTMLKQNLIPAFVGGLDTSKPMQRQITNVIGGGPNNWCAVDMTASGTSKKGKPWFHESVLLLKANSDGLWEEVKVFMDTLHIHNHVKDHAKK